MKNTNSKTVTFQHCRSQLAAAVLVAMLPTLTMAADLISQSSTNAHAELGPDANGVRPLITMESPTSGTTFESNAIAIVLNVSSKTSRRTVSVRLNGRNVSGAFHDSGSCLGQRSCDAVASFSLKHGLKSGVNRLVVRAEAIKSGWDRTPRREETKVHFSWKPSKDIDLTDPTAMQLTPTVAFTTLAPGGQVNNGDPWFQIYSNALNGGTRTFPLTTDRTCTTPYQVVVLDRQKLSERSYECYADDESLQIGLKSLVPNPNTAGFLVVVGTTWYNNAGPSLNTTAIGGTDYSDKTKYSASAYPQGYMVVGAAGAGPGQAYEVFNVAAEAGGSGRYNAQLGGVLSKDPSGNYNYHPSDNYLYSVDATHGQVTINGVVYTAPAAANPGFWLLRIHRVKLWNEHGCTSLDGGKTYEQCGESYNTTTQGGIDGLTAALQNVNPRDLAFLIAVGAPFAAPNTDGGEIGQALVQALESLGGSGYTLVKMASTEGNGITFPYTLISSSDPQFSKSFIGGNAVVSSSLFTNQFQTGSVYGVLARDLHNQFKPVNTSQLSSLTTTGIMDNSFFNLAWTQPGPWPDMDTSGHLAAYRYLSSYIVGVASNNKTQGDDIHALYPTSSNADIAGKDPRGASYPSGGTWLDPVDGVTYSFTQQDMTDVAKQLYGELFDLQTVNNYMYVANGGVKNALIANSSSGIIYELIGAAGAAVSDLNQQSSSTKVSLNVSDVSNLLGAACAVGAIILDPEDLPILALTSGVLWGAGSLGVTNPGSSDLPSPYVTIATDVGTLSGQLETYLTNFGNTFDSSMDNINTDWNKLNQIAIKTGINGSWQLPSSSSADVVTPVFQQAARTYFYTQIFSSLYQLDTFGAIGNKANQPWLLGSGQDQGIYPYTNTVCEAWYPKFTSTTDVPPYTVYPTPGSTSTQNDIFHIGGEIKQNNTALMTEKFPSTTYIDTILGTDVKNSKQLNLNFDQFWSPNGPLARRAGKAAPGYNGPLCTNLGKWPPSYE